MSAAPASRPLLEVEDLRVDYSAGRDPVRAVDGVSLEVRSGETVGVVGESGAGKTSALMAVPRLLPSGGRIGEGSRVRFRGVDLVGAGEDRMRRLRGREMGLIFQQPGASLNPVQRAGRAVAEAVREGRSLSGTDLRREVVRLLERAGLEDAEGAAGAYPHQLSGGMQQRVALAAAVAASPSLLLADEPTAALDVVVEAAVLERIGELQRAEDMAMVLVSHDLRVVAGVADRIAVMRGGRVVEQGPVDAVMDAPEHEYTRTLLEAAPRMPGAGGAERPARPAGGPSSARRATSRGEEPDGPGTDRPTADAPLVLARDLRRRYGRGASLLAGGEEVVAVRDVSFALRSGEAVGLVGASGAGKSTVARMITGAEEPDGGELRWRGRPVSSMGRRERGAYRRAAQLLHQDPFASLNPRMTVGRALREPLTVHGLARGDAADRRVEDLLSRVRLPSSAADRRPGELSGGERQRVALARALAVRPRLLVADEPVSALDVSVQARILDLMATLREELDLTLVLVAHDLAVVGQVCDRVLVLDGGRLVEEGETGRVLRTPSHPRTRELVEAASRGRRLP